MDKTDLSKELSEDMVRESLIAISYGVADSNLTAKLSSPKDANGGIAVEPLVLDGEEKYRSDLISISYSPSPDVEVLPLLSPVDLDG